MPDVHVHSLVCVTVHAIETTISDAREERVAVRGEPADAAVADVDGGVERVRGRRCSCEGSCVGATRHERCAAEAVGSGVSAVEELVLPGADVPTHVAGVASLHLRQPRIPACAQVERLGEKMRGEKKKPANERRKREREREREREEAKK